MRLWSIHPKYLDCKGLVALWREALLAKKVLQGRTKRHINHPQLDRFKELENPISFINTYLLYVLKEADRRCYEFDKRKIGRSTGEKMKVTQGQIEYEFRHLKKKLRKRDRKKYIELSKIKKTAVHPIFIVKKGPVEPWEKQRSA